MSSHPSVIETDLETLRHDCAQLLAQAVKELYPAAQVAIGPAIEHGFYYDFAFPQPLTADELPAIEQRMREIVFRREPIRRDESNRAQAEAYAREVAGQLHCAGLHVETDLRNEKIGYKIREHSVAKVPLLIVIGQREMQDGQVTLRWLHGGHQQTLPLAQALVELVRQNQYPSNLSGKQSGRFENP